MEFWNNTYKFTGETVVNDTPYNSPSINVNFFTIYEQGQKATLEISVREDGALQPNWLCVAVDCTPESDISSDFENWLTAEIGAWTKVPN